MSEAVDYIIALGTNNVNAFLVTHIDVVFLLHGYRCLEGGGQLILEIVLFQDISQAYRGDILEKQSLTFLIR